MCPEAWLSERGNISPPVAHLTPVLGIKLHAAVLAAPCLVWVLAPRQRSRWKPGLLSAFHAGFRAGMGLGEWRNSPDPALHHKVLQGMRLQRDAAGLAGTEECECGHLGRSRTTSCCPQAQENSLQPGCAPQKAGMAPGSSCSVHVLPVLWGCRCWAAQWCRALGRGHGVSVQDVFCPSPKATSGLQCGVSHFGSPCLCSASSPATRVGDGGCMVARTDVGRSSCWWGRFEVSSSLTQGPRE